MSTITVVQRRLKEALEVGVSQDNFTCDMCLQTFRRKSFLETHIKHHFFWKCPHCGIDFDNEKYLLKHINNHHNDDAFLCSKCGKKFATKARLANHSMSHVMKFECFCHEMFENRQRRTFHIKENHPEMMIYSCDKCKKSFAFEEDLEYHLQNHERFKENFICEICSKKFCHKHLLDTHLTRHTGENPYICSICAKTFGSKRYLQMHIRQVHTVNNFTCETCGKKYSSKAGIRNHRLSHLSVTPADIHCEICNRTFFDRQTLIIHQRLHNNERPYVCAQCGASYTVIGGLRRHLLTHTGEKSYTCEMCGDKLSTAFSLKRHYLKHTGEKPNQCELCDKKYASKTALLKHKKKHAENADIILLEGFS